MKTLLLSITTLILIGCGSDHNFKASGVTEHRITVGVDLSLTLEFCQTLCVDDVNPTQCVAACSAQIIDSITDLIGAIELEQVN